MKVKGTTRVLCVWGDPVAHTLSPLIHQIIIDHTGDDFVYVPFHVKPEDLAQAVQGAHALGIAGINCTIPHKQAVMPFLESLDEDAALCGAVNTLQYTRTGYRGFNTDIYGIMRITQQAGIDLAGRKVLLLGAGGASHSVLTACERMHAAQIVVYNRTYERAKALKDEFAARHFSVPIRLIHEEDLEKEPFPIVYQTTSAGMVPQTDTVPVPLFRERFYSCVEQAFDLVYNPKETLFCHAVREYGGQAVNGLTMLLYQGLRSYEIWTGRKFSEDEILLMEKTYLEQAEKALYAGEGTV